MRLVGDLRAKRVLDLGTRNGAAAVTFAQHGAIVIALDATRPPGAGTARAEQAEVKVEWRVGDLADLAFLRAESIDAAFSAYAVAEVDDAARLFRQVQRVLKPNAPFVFSYDHPMALCVDDAGAVARSYFDPGPIDVGPRRRAGARLRPRRSARCSPSSDAPASASTPSSNPGPSPPARGCPTTIVWRARKEGA